MTMRSGCVLLTLDLIPSEAGRVPTATTAVAQGLGRLLTALVRHRADSLQDGTLAAVQVSRWRHLVPTRASACECQTPCFGHHYQHGNTCLPWSCACS